MKKDKVIAIVVVLICIGIPIFCYLSNKTNKTNINKNTNIDTINNNSNDWYGAGLYEYEKEMYEYAQLKFEKVKETDSNYTKAQEMIKKCEEKRKEKILIDEQKRKEKEKENLKKEKIKIDLEKKYKRVFGGSGWIHEKQEKLLRNDFKQYKSGFESCPDGSNQLAMYYKKYEYGFYIHLMLQYSYSLSSHYCRIWVE